MLILILIYIFFFIKFKIFLFFQCVLTMLCILPLFVKETISLYREIKNRSNQDPSYRVLNSDDPDRNNENGDD
jgi:hypothetical protein